MLLISLRYRHKVFPMKKLTRKNTKAIINVNEYLLTLVMSEFSRYKLNNGLTLINTPENFSSNTGNTVAVPVTIANQKILYVLIILPII